MFWLGGFSSDPKYPISGEGGPSYAVIDPSQSINITSAERREHDPLQRNWVFPFEVARLQPARRTTYFDETGNRFIEYQVNVNGVNQTRRINFWQYVPSQVGKAVLVLRHIAARAGIPDGLNLIAAYDPPAATDLNPNALHVHAIKSRSESDRRRRSRSSLPTKTNSKSCTPASTTSGARRSRKCRCMSLAPTRLRIISSIPTARSPATSPIRLPTSPRAPSKRVNRDES